MTEEEKLTVHRLQELSKRSYDRGIWCFSDFLNLAEQDAYASLRLPGSTLFGGYEGAERKLAVFGSEETCGYEALPPVVCLKIAPALDKFADDLTHRDFLGALMNLGIRREMLGDIVVQEKSAFLFCLDTVAETIVRELTRVRHTTVRVTELSELPEFFTEKPPISTVNVASVRLDGLICAVFDLSRADGQKLIGEEKVFCNARLARSSSQEVAEGTIVSVRGLGRFLYEGVDGETRRGRLRVNVRKY